MGAQSFTNVLEQIKRHLTRAEIVDVISRGPNGWKNIGDKLKTAVFEEEHFDKILDIYQEAQTFPCPVELNWYEAEGELLGGVVTYDLGDRSLAMLDAVNGRNPELRQQHEVMKSLPMITQSDLQQDHIAICGPTTSSATCVLNNGISSYNPDTGEFQTTGIPGFKGGIFVNDDLSIDLVTSEQRTNLGLGQGRIAEIGASLTFSTDSIQFAKDMLGMEAGTLAGIQSEDGEAKLHKEDPLDLYFEALSITIENCYLNSYNNQFGFLSQSPDGNWKYHFVSFSPESTVFIRENNPDFPQLTGENVAWGVYLVLRELARYDEPRNVVLLEEFNTAIPDIVPNKNNIIKPIWFAFPGRKDFDF